jgi:CBS domain-containing protein
MTVRNVLASKKASGVHTISPDATVADAVAELGARRIGALVVSADLSHADGILSERDIVRELGRVGPDVLKRPVSELMTRQLKCCEPADRAENILRQMTEGRFRHMPVVEGGELVGIISLGDVVNMRLSEVQVERDALESMITGHA